MAEITIRGQAYALDLFKGLEGDALDEKLLEINGVGEKTLPKVRETVLSALADETSPACRNFDKCGNEAEEGHAYCANCYRKWQKEQVSEEDRETRPKRLNSAERLEKACGFYVSYYKDEDPQEWPQEVREAFLAAQLALTEGDSKAKEAANEDDPNPGLFKVARWHYFQVRNHLAIASYHSSRISAKGVLKGLSNFARRQLEEAMGDAEKAMVKAGALEGYKKTRQLQVASRVMRDALNAARKEKASMNKPKAAEFYGGVGEGAVIGDSLSEDQLKDLERLHRRKKKAEAHSN